jgi:hypothetical protein
MRKKVRFSRTFSKTPTPAIEECDLERVLSNFRFMLPYLNSNDAIRSGSVGDIQIAQRTWAHNPGFADRVSIPLKEGTFRLRNLTESALSVQGYWANNCADICI